MKKLSFMLLSLLAVTMFTACGNDDEPVNKQTVTSTLNARMVNASDGIANGVVFSQNTGKIELNYTDMTIKISTTYKDENGATQSLNTPEMQLERQSGTCYKVVTHNGQTGSIPLMIDLGSGMMWYRMETSANSNLFLTTHLLYAYTTTTMHNPDNNNHGSHDQSAYLFALDSKGETCIMQITNFISNMNGAVDAQEVQYEGLTVTPTTEGYKITADRVESNYKGFYTLTDVNFNLYYQCLQIDGTFKCNGLTYNISGSLFPAN